MRTPSDRPWGGGHERVRFSGDYSAKRLDGAGAVIIRHKHTGSFTVVPNAIFNDDRLSLTAKGLLGYLLSRPRNWEVRHDQLQRKLDIGRKLLSKLLNELREAGYLERDEEQGRDDQNRFTTLNYVVRDIPELTAADVPTPLRSEPPHKRDTGNNKEEIKTESTKPFPKPLPTEQGDTQLARQWVYSEFGERAFAAGQRAVYLGSKPYQAWLSYRGKDGMPGFIDRAIINGKVQEIVWMPSLYPPRRSADESERDGGWSNL